MALADPGLQAASTSWRATWYALKYLTSWTASSHAARVLLGCKPWPTRTPRLTHDAAPDPCAVAARLTIWSASGQRQTAVLVVGSDCCDAAPAHHATHDTASEHAGGRMNMQVRPHVGYGCVDCVPLLQLQPQRCDSTHFFSQRRLPPTWHHHHAGTLVPVHGMSLHVYTRMYWLASLALILTRHKLPSWGTRRTPSDATRLRTQSVVLLGMHHYSHWGTRRCARGTPARQNLSRAWQRAARRGTLCPRSLAKLERIALTRAQFARFVLRCPVRVTPKGELRARCAGFC
jgi:hypothetical protein